MKNVKLLNVAQISTYYSIHATILHYKQQRTNFLFVLTETLQHLVHSTMLHDNSKMSS